MPVSAAPAMVSSDEARAVMALMAAASPDEAQEALVSLDVPCRVRDALIVRSLYLAACGIEAGDPAAAMKWLVNRDPDRWTAKSRSLPKSPADLVPARDEPLNPLDALRVVP